MMNHQMFYDDQGTSRMSIARPLYSHSSTKSDSVMKAPWMIIFADLLALMLTFFVLLFAISEMSKEQLEYASQKNKAKRESLSPQVLPYDTITPTKSGLPHGRFTLEYMENVLKQNLGVYIHTGEIKIIRNPRHVAVLIPLARLFKPNHTILNAAEQPLIVDISRALLNFNHSIAIEMELETNASHAIQVATHKRGHILADRLQALGYKHPIPVFTTNKVRKIHQVALLLTTREAGN